MSSPFLFLIRAQSTAVQTFGMGNQNQSLNPGGAGDGQEKKKEEKKKYEPPPPPRTGRKKVKKGPDSNARLPAVTPNSKCRLRLLKLERVKDYLLMEEEFIQNQERLKPQEEKSQASIFEDR